MNRIKSVNKYFLIAVISFLGFSIIAGIFLGIIMGITGKGETFTVELSLMISQASIIIPAIIYLKYKGQNIKETIGFHKLKISNIFLVFLFTICIVPLTTLLNLISMIFVNNFIGETTTGMEGNLLIVNLLVLAVLPGICEEFVFRGILFEAYKKKSVLGGALLCGVAFGLFHMNINQFIYAFVLGFVFALLKEATGTIVAPMLAHFIFNGNSVFLMWLFQKLPETPAAVEPSLGSTIMTYLVITLIFTPIAILILIAISKTNNRFNYLKSIFSKKARAIYKDEYLYFMQPYSNEPIAPMAGYGNPNGMPYYGGNYPYNMNQGNPVNHGNWNNYGNQGGYGAQSYYGNQMNGNNQGNQPYVQQYQNPYGTGNGGQVPNNQWQNQPQNGYPNNQWQNQPQNGYSNDQMNNQPQNGYSNDQMNNQPQTSYSTNQTNNQPQTSYSTNQTNNQPQTGYPTSQMNNQPQTGYSNSEMNNEPQTGYPNNQMNDQPQTGYPNNQMNNQPQTGYPYSQMNHTSQDGYTNNQSYDQLQMGDYAPIQRAEPTKLAGPIKLVTPAFIGGAVICMIIMLLTEIGARMLL